jgi:hypothetical protein
MKIEHSKKKLIFAESSFFPIKQGTVPTHGSICKDPKIPQCIVTPNGLLHCKSKKAVASENLASVNLLDKQSTTIENHEIFVAQSAEISPTIEQQVLKSSCDVDVELLFDICDDVVGLSLMSHEVQCDGTIIEVKGQRSKIFQLECKIKEKLCKFIIDGGSFTNVISSNVVDALSLSKWWIPTPHYMQWMNQSGTLTITHRSRVRISVGDYVDSVDYDVAPMSACHLLLGRPWKYDIDSTHEGHSNNYMFVHKAVSCVDLPCCSEKEKAIKK